MTFDATSRSWSITADLVVGEMKFRANNDWAINLGDNSPADAKPEYDGGNIAVGQAGNYTITLNIGIGGNYTYKLRKN
jgi:starch-binding outer membrane protein SusE/F